MISLKNLATLASFFAIYFGIALQIQATLGETENYLGLRINLGDLLLPIAGIIVLNSLIAKKSRWPEWRVKYGYGWIIALILAILLANVNSYLVNGMWSRWGLLNKGIGWLVLMTYFFLGAWLTTNFDDKPIRYFMKSLLFFFIGALPFFLIILILKDMGFDLGIATISYPLSGFMANRNAYGFLLVACLLFTTLFSYSKKPIIPLIWVQILWGLLPLALVYNGSLACIGMSGIVIIGILMKKRSHLQILLPLLIGVIFLFIFIEPEIIFKKRQIKRIAGLTTFSQENIKIKKNGLEIGLAKDRLRISLIKDSFELWQQHPIFGAGLGSFMVDQIATYGGLTDTIHSTSLWIMTEMGIVGLLIFVSFYILCLKALWKRGPSKENFSSIFSFATFYFLLCFGLMSLVHEFIYTRHMWMIMGFALAVPIAMRVEGEGELRII